LTDGFLSGVLLVTNICTITVGGLTSGVLISSTTVLDTILAIHTSRALGADRLAIFRVVAIAASARNSGLRAVVSIGAGAARGRGRSTSVVLTRWAGRRGGRWVRAEETRRTVLTPSCAVGVLTTSALVVATA
jgi:hypothetical protein